MMINWTEYTMLIMIFRPACLRCGNQLSEEISVRMGSLAADCQTGNNNSFESLDFKTVLNLIIKVVSDKNDPLIEFWGHHGKNCRNSFFSPIVSEGRGIFPKSEMNIVDFSKSCEIRLFRSATFNKLSFQ